MRLTALIGSPVAALVMALTSPAAAQGTPPSDDRSPEKSPSTEPAAPGPGGTSPAVTPQDAQPAPPPTETPAAEPAAPSQSPAPAAPQPALPDAPEAAPEPFKIGSTLSPLLVTAGIGYAYASVNHPDLKSQNLSGVFLEVAAGTEIDKRFRLTLAFTSFETRLRRAGPGIWEEGHHVPPIARSGLGALKDPVEPVTPKDVGGAEVEKGFLAHSLGPRMDFLPLGSQGPYLGMSAGVAVIQRLTESMRWGGHVSARVGGEWRPFHVFAIAIEAGAHGQIYEDAKAAIPYAMTRMTLLLEPSQLGSSGRAPVPLLPMQRTLPPPMPR